MTTLSVASSETAPESQTLSPFRPSAWDWVGMLLCVVLGSVGVWSVYNSDIWADFWRPGSTVGRQLGEVEKQQGSARFRSRGSLVWFDLGKRRVDVRGGDAVATAEDGIASVNLSNQASVEIAPSSLVIITDPKEAFLAKGTAAALSLSRGLLRVKLLNKNVKLQVDDYVISVESGEKTGELQMKRNAAHEAIEFRSSVAMVLKVRSGMNPEVKTISVQPSSPVQLKDPVSLKEIHEELPVESAPPAAPVMKLDAIATPVPAPAAAAPAEKTEAAPEEAASGAVADLPAPSLQNPPDGAVRSGKTLLTWAFERGATGYEVEIAANSRFTKNTARVLRRQNFHVLVPRGSADVFWRVRSVSGKQMSPWSKAFRLRFHAGAKE